MILKLVLMLVALIAIAIAAGGAAIIGVADKGDAAALKFLAKVHEQRTRNELRLTAIMALGIFWLAWAVFS